MISSEQVSIDDLERELQRRQSLEIQEFREQIERHRQAILRLEDRLSKIAETDELDIPMDLAVPATPVLTSPTERFERILKALGSRGALTIPELSRETGYQESSLRSTVEILRRNGKLDRVGARYQIAG